MKSQATIQGLALSVVALAAGTASEAAAHAKLLSEAPAANTAAPSPKTLVLHFSEAVAPQFTGVELTGPAGGEIVVVALPSKDASTLLVGLPSPLATGHYSVKWHAAATDDGHRTSGGYQFTVR